MVKFFGERQTVAGIDRTKIINQIISSYRWKLKTPKDYYDLKAKLETLKDDELQAELSKCLPGSYKAPWNMGLSVEQNKDVVVPYILPEQPAETPKKELSPQEKLQEQIKQDLLDCGIFVSKYNTPTLELLTQIYQEAPKNGNRTYKDFVQKFQDIVFEYKDKPVKNPDELRKKLLCELNLDFYPSYPQDRKKVEEMRLQNYTAQTISNIYSFLADSYEELFNRGSLTADASAALKELATGVSVKDYIQALKQNAENFGNLSPEKMNYADFKKTFKAVFGVEYNEKAVQELMQYCSENPQLDILKDKNFKEKFKNLFGDTVDFSKIKNMGIASKWGDIALTLAMFTVIHNTKPMINLKSKTQAFNSALGMGEKRDEILTRFVTGAASMGAYTASAGTLDNLITGTPANSDKWAELPKEVLAALPFGGFAGALDAIAVSPVLQKMIPDGVKAAQSALASGTECSGTDFLKILYNSTTKQKLINLAAFLGRGVYTAGVYGAGNTVYGVTADLITNGTQNIPEGEFLKYLGANFKEHFKGMGEYEIMSLVQMFGAGRLGAMTAKGSNKPFKMPEFKNLDNITVKMETVDGKQMYKVKVEGSTDGKTKPVEKYTESFDDIVNLFHTIAIADVQMANNTSPQTETNPTTPSLLFKPKATATEPTTDKPETPKSPANSPEKPLQQEKPETVEADIKIPKGKFAAPSEKFAETDEAFQAMIEENKYKILSLYAEYRITGNKENYLNNLYPLICREMDIENVSLQIVNEPNTNDGGAFIPATRKVKLNINYNGDPIEQIIHELNHFLQIKEQLITGNGVDVVANNDAVQLTGMDVQAGEVTTQAEANQRFNDYYRIGKEGYLTDYSDILNGIKYPKNTNPNDYYFQKANKYNQADIDYVDANDNYSVYRNNYKEVESFRRGQLCASIINDAPKKQVIDLILERISNADEPTKLALVDVAIEEMQMDRYINYTAERFISEFFQKHVTFN